MSADDMEDRLVDVDSPELPPDVRRAVLEKMRLGDGLWRCPRLGGLKGGLSLFGLGRRDVVIEWWLISGEGELIEAFWEA